jgi:hypothetical protein
MSICSTAISREGFQIDGTVRPIAVTFATARNISGLGLTTLWKLGKQHRIELVRVGRRTLITYRSLERLLLPQPSPVDASERRRRGRPRKQQPTLTEVNPIT